MRRCLFLCRGSSEVFMGLSRFRLQNLLFFIKSAMFAHSVWHVTHTAIIAGDGCLDRQFDACSSFTLTLSGMSFLWFVCHILYFTAFRFILQELLLTEAVKLVTLN